MQQTAVLAAEYHASGKSLGVPLPTAQARRCAAPQVEAPPPAAPLYGRLATWEAVRAFIFAGNARFTLRSLRTGARYTYRVRAKKADVEAGLAGEALTYFVETLRGPDNTADYRYLGVLRQPGRFWFTVASQQRRDSASAQALIWALNAMRCGRAVLGVQLEVWHEGRCGRCGRALTVPESVGRGMGPECAGRMI